MNTQCMIDVRTEAIRTAVQLKDITAGNIIAIAREIERYILADAKLPEIGTDYYQALLDKFTDNMNKQRNDWANIGFASVKPNEGTK